MAIKKKKIFPNQQNVIFHIERMLYNDDEKTRSSDRYNFVDVVSCLWVDIENFHSLRKVENVKSSRLEKNFEVKNYYIFQFLSEFFFSKII